VIHADENGAVKNI